MTQPPFAGNDRFNQQGQQSAGGYGNPGRRPEHQSRPEYPSQLEYQSGPEYQSQPEYLSRPGAGQPSAPPQYSGGSYGPGQQHGPRQLGGSVQQGGSGQQCGPGAQGGSGHYRPGPPPGQPGQSPQSQQLRAFSENLTGAGAAPTGTPSAGLQTVLAAVVGLLGIAGFVLGFFQAVSVVTPAGEIDAGKTIIVAGAIPILLLAAGIAALGTVLRRSGAAGVWLAVAALALASALGAGAIIYLYSSGDYTTAAPDASGPEYKIQIGLFGGAGVGAVMFILGLAGYLAAAKFASATLSAQVVRATRELSAHVVDRAVSAATEAATAAATAAATTAASATARSIAAALVAERLTDLQRTPRAASELSPEPRSGSRIQTAAATVSAQVPLEGAPTEVTRTPFAHQSTSQSGQSTDPALSIFQPPESAANEDQRPPADQNPVNESEPAMGAESEVTQMTRLPPAEQLRAAADDGAPNSAEPASSRASAPVNTPRWQTGDQQTGDQQTGHRSAESGATPPPDPGSHPQQMDEPTMRYRAMPQAEPESYVWPIQQQPVAVDPLEQAPTYTENPDYRSVPSDAGRQRLETEAEDNPRPPAPPGPAPSEWNLQPPQYPPAPQDSARYAAIWDDTQDQTGNHPGEVPVRPWPSIPRAE